MGVTNSSAVPISSVPVSDIDTSAMPSLIAALLGTSSAATEKKGSPCRDVMVRESLEKTAAAFTRLRDPSTPMEDKSKDIERICKCIRKLDEAVEVQADPNKMVGTGVVLRIDVSFEASQVVHMMQKFYNADRAAISVPELAPVRKLCATTLDFVNFVVRTALISMSVDRKAQAVEVLNVLEKRLLKTPFAEREPPKFREMVQTYSNERAAMGLGKASGPDAVRHLEWYLSNAVANPQLLTTFDKVVGRPYYFKLAMAPGTSNQQIRQFRAGVSTLPEVACFGGSRGWCVVYGGTSKERVAIVRNLIRETASCAGIRFDERNSQECTPSIRIGQFQFSDAGAFQNAAAA
jgi:hypothetical protein